MKIGKYYVDATETKGVERIDGKNKSVICNGYYCKIFEDPAQEILVDDCFLAEGYEIADLTEKSLKQGLTKYLGITEGITEKRKSELIENFIGWFLESNSNDEELFNTLHNAIGMTQGELHDFSVESLDGFFNNEKKAEKTNYAGAVRSSVKKEYNDFKESMMMRAPRTIINASKKIFFYQQMTSAILKAEDGDEMYRALYRIKDRILDLLHKEYCCSYEANFCTLGDAREFIDNFCEYMGLNEQYDDEEEKLNETITAEDLVEQAVYKASTPDCPDAEQAEKMLGMLGANVVDEEERPEQTLG